MALLIKAVKNGAFVSDYVVITAVSGKTITFNQSGATGANIYAFPNGSAITLSGSVVGNGVTYTASKQTEQAISNTDLFFLLQPGTVQALKKLSLHLPLVA